MKKLPLLLCSFLLLASLLRSQTPALSNMSFTTSRVQFATGDSITIREVLATSSTLKAGDVLVVRGDYALQSKERARIIMFTNATGNVPSVLKEVTAGSGTFELQYNITIAGQLRITFYDAAPPNESFGGLYFDVTGAASTAPTRTTTTPPAGMVAVSFLISRAQFGTNDSLTVREMFATSSALRAGDTILVRGDYTMNTTPHAVLLMFSNIGGTVPTARQEITSAAGTFELRYVLPAAGTLRLSFYHADAPGDYLGGLYLDGVTGPSVSTPANANGRLSNLSTRGLVTASDTMMAGLAVTEQDRFVLIRAVGPGLSAFGVSGVLRKPVITLRNSNGDVMQTVGSWSALSADQRTGIPLVTESVGGFPLAAGSDDAVLHIRLTPGTYTITISSGDGQPGTALLEVYAAGTYLLP